MDATARRGGSRRCCVARLRLAAARRRRRCVRAAPRSRSRRAPNSNDFACGHLTVPLDPSGATPGTITLAHAPPPRPVGEAHSAIIALAGGPGQPALPFAEAVRRTARPDRRDARSDRLRPARHRPVRAAVLPRLRTPRPVPLVRRADRSVRRPARARRAASTRPPTPSPTSRRSAQAGGYEKLVLYGTSYGTKVAEQYAQEYPSHVEALVLDSVVPPNGPEPLDRSTFAAMPRILRQLCAERRVRAHHRQPRRRPRARACRRMARAPLHRTRDRRAGQAHSDLAVLRRAARTAARRRLLAAAARRIRDRRRGRPRAATRRRSRA